MARVAAETRVVTQMGTQTGAEAGNLGTIALVKSGALGEITECHLSTNRPIWPRGYDRPDGEDPVPSTLDWDLWLGPVPMRPFKRMYPQGHLVYSPTPEKQMQSRFKLSELTPVPPAGVVYHPFVWRGWKDFDTAPLGDGAPHGWNVMFMALDLGTMSAADIIETSPPKKKLYPNCTIMRFEWAQRGVHPPFKIYHYDGGKVLPKEVTGGGRGMTWIGTKGSLPQGRGPFLGQKADPYPTPPQLNWGREEVHEDWCIAIKTGKQAPCHFGYAGPFAEAYLLGDIALLVGHRIEWVPLAFRITNCREANQYLTGEYRRGWDLNEIAGDAT